MNKERNELRSSERRNFLKLAGAGSFTAAKVAGAAGALRPLYATRGADDWVCAGDFHDTSS